MVVGEFAEEALGGFHGGRTVAHEADGKGAGFAQEVGLRDDAADEPESLGFRRGDEAAGEKKVAAGFFAELGTQESGNDGGHEADANFGKAEFRFGHGKGEVAEGGDAYAARDGRTVDSGDGGLGQRIQGVQQSRD